MTSETQDRDALLADALERFWYHTIELEPGKVTRGHVDMRPVAGRLLPDDMTGLRALDVGTFDGFWAFEMERRGAETVATDLDVFDDSDWPQRTRERMHDGMGQDDPGERFRIAHRLRGSSVKRIGASIYELDADALGGPVDFVFIGDLLLHLRDPVGGLERARSVMAAGARIVSMEPIDLPMSVFRRKRPYAELRAGRTDFDWWVGNIACLRAWLTLAGFQDLRRVHRRAVFRNAGVPYMRQWHVALTASVPAAG